MRHLPTFLSILSIVFLSNQAIADDNQRTRDKTIFDVALQAEMSQGSEASEGKARPTNRVVIIPFLLHSSHNDLTTDRSGTKMKVSKGHSNGLGFVGVYSNNISDALAASISYTFSFQHYSGGLLVVDHPSVDGRTSQDAYGQALALTLDWNAKEWGRFQFYASQAVDLYNGKESYIKNGSVVDVRDTNSFWDRISAFQIWYENDLYRDEQWQVSPYLGFRATYIHLEDINAFRYPQNSSKAKFSAHSWSYYTAGGLKMSYKATDQLSFNLRGGVNHRTAENQATGACVRAMAPNVMMSGYMLNFDNTIGSAGLGLRYAVPESKLSFNLNYNGMYGKNTQGHMVNAGLVVPF